MGLGHGMRKAMHLVATRAGKGARIWMCSDELSLTGQIIVNQTSKTPRLVEGTDFGESE